RLERVAQTTDKVLAYLKQQPLVEKIYFPFDPGFDQYELARQQMKNAGGLLSFVLRADRVEAIEAFCERLQHIWMAVSWGGYESLIIPRCAGMPREQFDANDPVHRMIRLYVGLEEPDYLIRDLEQAFATLAG
ncbi:MAG TPA: PLP-dependent transferase, partial [Ferruginibacter sp.]|nr:PLP-dependent transferase [Ferruginibacter sp.]